MMKSGTYYVGDLCYIFDNEEWSDICLLTVDGHTLLDGEFNLPDGRRFASFKTRWGDGSYEDMQGRRYPVDSGTIGCIRVDDIKTGIDLTEENIIEFTAPFNVYSKDGCIYFGNIEIDTDPVFDHEEEEY